MALASFLMQLDPPALAFGVVILDAHGDDAPIRAKAKVITLISARSRSPTTQGTSLIVPSSA